MTQLGRPVEGSKVDDLSSTADKAFAKRDKAKVIELDHTTKISNLHSCIHYEQMCV